MSRFSRCVVAGSLLLVWFALAAVLAACGDPYTGTWSATMPDGEKMTIKIEQKDDAYQLSLAGAEDEGTLRGVESDGKLVVTQDSETMTFERDGDNLQMSVASAAGLEVTFTRD